MDIMHLEVLEVEDRLKVGELHLTVEVLMEQNQVIMEMQLQQTLEVEEVVEVHRLVHLGQGVLVVLV